MTSVNFGNLRIKKKGNKNMKTEKRTAKSALFETINKCNDYLTDEEKVIRDISKSQKKKLVDKETFFNHHYIGDCKYCMNYDYEKDECKILNEDDEEYQIDDCSKWEYIYEYKEDI